MMRWNSTKTYTEEDMLKMQQEAVNRVHEFQARAQDVSYYDMPTVGERHAPPMLEAQSQLVPTPDLPQSQAAAPLPQVLDPINGLLEKLDIDGETLLVLGLMFLLYNEKADSTLLIALAYLLL